MEDFKATHAWELSENLTLQLRSGACCFNGKIRSKFSKVDMDTQRVWLQMDSTSSFLVDLKTHPRMISLYLISSEMCLKEWKVYKAKMKIQTKTYHCPVIFIKVLLIHKHLKCSFLVVPKNMEKSTRFINFSGLQNN